MSQNYKIISRTKEAVLELMAQGWVKKKIYEHIGIAPGLLNEILEYDPVSVGVKAVTIAKLEAFLENWDKMKKVRSGEAEPTPDVLPETPHEPEAEFVMTREHYHNEIRTYTITGTEMDLLKSLTEIFQQKGYRLDVHITKIFIPDENNR